MESIVFFIVYLLGFLVSLFIAKHILGIPTIIKHLKANTNLLSVIAEKNGVDRDFIVRVISKAERPEKWSEKIELPSEN